jgi:hypothetical protein
MITHLHISSNSIKDDFIFVIPYAPATSSHHAFYDELLRISFDGFPHHVSSAEFCIPFHIKFTPEVSAKITCVEKMIKVFFHNSPHGCHTRRRAVHIIEKLELLHSINLSCG